METSRFETSKAPNRLFLFVQPVGECAAKRPLTQRKIVLTKVLAPFMISMAVPKTMDTQAQEIEPVRATTKMKPMMGQSS